MTVLASFIGIDKYRDDCIRELSGARRDATALWALFSDSISGMQARLLVNDKATREGVRKALQETLGAAGPEDTVIVSFAGHGSRSHRLMMYDTDADQVGKTSLSMGELCDLFRETQARSVLILLDCCFSGGAAARVFEDDEPIPRDLETPLDTLVQGKGRILIAACNTNESAYEHPPTRHGLFTKALLDALQSFPGVVNVQEVMAQVMDRMRAETARLDLEQTPMLYQGLVEGGLTLPPLRPGPLFEREFPEIHGVKVRGDVQDLAAFGLPDAVLRAWAERFTGGLNDLQQQAINDYRVLDGRSLLVVAPTSSGKTMIGEMAAVRAVTEGRKAVFLLPYKALTSEKYDQFDALYGDQLGLRVIRVTGDYTDQGGAFARGKYDLACMTYEMFLSLAVSNPVSLSQIGLVVLDEAQFITDPKRGITVELLLTFLVAAREKSINPQIVALSAVIGAVNHFHEWLGCEALITDKRPIKLTEGVIDHDGVYQFRDEQGNTQTKQMVPRHLVHQRRKEPSGQDVFVPLVRQLMSDPAQKIILFRNIRNKSVSCAKYMAEGLGLPPATGTIAQLPTGDLSTDSALLRACLNGGTAFHNTDLNREERAVVERAYRDPQGDVRVLAATTTVAAGINTPASVVILADHRFFGEDERDFTVAEYRNMTGRAGRLGYQEEGLSLLYAATATERNQLFHQYVLGQPEPLASSFNTGEIETWMLRLLAQVPRVPRDQIITLLASTFGGYLSARRHPDWKAALEVRLDALLIEMLTWKLVEQDGAAVQLTPIGRACGRSTLSYASCIRLIQLLSKVPPQTLTHERLMALVQNLPESDGGYTPSHKGSKKEALCPAWAAERYGRDMVFLYQEHAQAGDYLKRCKRACILANWVDGVGIEDIEARYTSHPSFGATSHGDIRRFADNTRYQLRAAHEIASLVHITIPAGADDLDAILKRLEVGLPAVALGLLDLPVTLSRGECMALARSGLTTPEGVWGASTEALTRAVGTAQAEQIDRARPGT